MELKKIISSVQNICEAIASVIKVDVTIVDNHLQRIAGTGRYQDSIGRKVDENSAFGAAVKLGENFIIENPRQHEICLRCDDIQVCKEYAEVCCPIKVEEEIVGVIGLIAFDEEQKKAIVYNQYNLMRFLNKMADLISTKLVEMENTDKIKALAKELEVVLDSVDRGIIAADNEGKILRYNKKALQLLKVQTEDIYSMNIKEITGEASFSSLLKKNYPLKNRQFFYRGKKHSFRGIYDAKPISLEEKPVGFVFTFSNISDVLNTVNDLTTGTIITGFDNIIGKNDKFNNVKIEAKKAANSTSTILIQGESGTGKELFARAIHYESHRRKEPFIPINCGAIPEQLLESELFGYEEGAFTGARKGGKEGKFQLANKGTLFLDEIGDMPLHLQSKLLRVLQEKMIEKVGGKDYIPIDVRVIAATNQDLEEKVLEKSFREDLFYRINVIPINIPPLRQRGEDILILIEYLLDKCNKKLGKQVEAIDLQTIDILKGYSWPGNVRELENTIEYAVNMCNEQVIKAMHLPNRLTKKTIAFETTNPRKILPIKEVEKIEITKAIHLYKNDSKAITKAAKALGIGRATLYRKLKEYDIETVSK
ncbi:sigma-54-dependent Fis family transcriptional regulator [Natronincola peptidivorans]|nr:sigma 54-interacting transcriptional regulator [Natronincola peptidivorans]